VSSNSETATHAADVVDTAKQQVSQVAEQGRGTLRSQVDSRSTQAGEQAQSVAETLRETATQLRQSGDQQKARYARIADQGADRLDHVGRYLSESDADELLSKVEDAARRQPWLVAGMGLLLGIGAARFLKASSTERYHRSQLANGRPGTATWEPHSGLAGVSEARPAVPAGTAV
jgi:hypothetical protein